MTLIIPPGFGNAAIVMTSTVGTPPLVTTIGVDMSNAGGAHVDVANVVMSAYANSIGTTTDSSITVSHVTLTVGQDGPGGSVDSDLPPIPCTRSGSSTPVSLAAIIRKSTNDLGRRGRGRMFLPGVLTQTEVGEDGVIPSVRVGTLQTAVSDFYDLLAESTDPTTGPLPPVLFHSAAPADPSPITGLTVAPLVGWIRGRIR